MNSKVITSILVSMLLFSQLGLAQETPQRPRPERPNPPPAPPTPPGGPIPPPQSPSPENIEQALQQLVEQQGLSAVDASTLNVRSVDDELVQLGKKLFFTKNLGGQQSVACASCHHPSLGGGDDLSLSVGVAAVDQFNNQAHELLGLGRFNGNDEYPVVPRNAPTIYNIALYTRGLFWDSRVERLRNGALVTPDSALDNNGRRLPDVNLPNDATLANAQARFPVTSVNEMRGNFVSGESNQAVRSALVSRLNDDIENITSNWPAEFSLIFNDQQVTSDRVFSAIGEYERSMIFIDNPWQHYLAGDSNALSTEQKQGALLFFTPAQQGGAGCSACHNGPTFSDQRHHLVAFPQIGVGQGNTSSTNTSQDFGRENVTNNSNDRYHFRTPSLLNVAATAPYGHTGAYQTLEQVIGHYNNPRRSVERLFGVQNNQPFANGDAPYCHLPQVQALMNKHQLACDQVFSDAFTNSIDVANYLQQARDGQVSATAPLRARINLSAQQIQQVSAFLHALTDPCVESKACLAPWLLSDEDLATFPDDQALQAVDRNGDAL